MTKRRVKGEGSVYRRRDGAASASTWTLMDKGRNRYISAKSKAEVRQKLREPLENREYSTRSLDCAVA
jgi:hypothetical protein